MTASRAPAPPAAAGTDRATFETFLIQEARLLDERRFREWMELFAEDGTYWVPAVPDQASPFDQASLFYDDRQAALAAGSADCARVFCQAGRALSVAYQRLISP